MSQFTPLCGLVGGCLIGLASAILLLGNGDILGFSGIFSTIILNPLETVRNPNYVWKISFLSCFCLSASIYNQVAGSALDEKFPPPSNLGYLTAGFLTGIGTKLSNGCTSGHGICGLARFSKRSIVAVCVFMTSAVITASNLSTLTSFWSLNAVVHVPFSPTHNFNLFAAFLCAFTLIFLSARLQSIMKKTNTDQSQKNVQILEKTVVSAIAGSISAIGLGISGMTNPSKVYNFLNLRGLENGTWDATLMFVMGGGLLVSILLGYNFVRGYELFEISFLSSLSHPIVDRNQCIVEFNMPPETKIDIPLILGALLFGIGWAIGGVCPGPSLFLATIGYQDIIFLWWPGYISGACMGNHFHATPMESRLSSIQKPHGFIRIPRVNVKD